MTLSMLRIVLFTQDMPGMVAFYRDVLGLRLAGGHPRSASGPRTLPPRDKNFWAAAPRCLS